LPFDFSFGSFEIAEERKTLRVVIIGTGRVSCGALGLALAMQGHEVIFAARRPDVAQSLTQLGYDVMIKGQVETLVEVRGVRAVPIESAEFAEAVASVDQIYTAVRPDNLPGIAPQLASALLHRIQSGSKRPLDIFCCENLKNAGSQLERLIFTNVPFAYAHQVQDGISFNAAVSDRIVSGQETAPTGRVLVTADATGDVLFDTLQIKGDFEILPPFKGLDNFPASIEEKLYVLNCGHAVCAYLGFMRGYKFIHEAMADEEIRRVVVGAMLESQRALQSKHGRSLHYAGMINEILESFSNAALQDTIARVGRDPVRKLQADDRLIGPLKLAYRYGIETPFLIQGCAAALSFAQSDDPQASELHKLMQNHGAAWTLESVAHLKAWNPITKMIVQQCRENAASKK
jgi:mannitol-1-phosphate 5-dehydrogenase